MLWWEIPLAESPNLSVLTSALHYISVGESLILYCEGKWRISAGGEDATEVWTKSNIVEFIITPATTTKDTLACTFPHARELQERRHSAWLQVKHHVAPALSVGRVQCPSAVRTTPYLDSIAVHWRQRCGGNCQGDFCTSEPQSASGTS